MIGCCIASSSQDPSGRGRDLGSPPRRAADSASLEDFELLEMIGSGGSSVLYQAQARSESASPERVVVKLPARGDEARARAQLDDEAACLSALGSLSSNGGDSGIIELRARLLGPQGLQGLVLQLVGGPTLDSLIAAHGALPWRWAVSLLRAVLDALTVVHGAGWVHLDLKPSNLICVDFRSFAEPARVKLIDFGVAARVDALAQAPGQVAEQTAEQAEARLGTSTYAAPERAAGRAVDARADLYALGVVLFEVLGGQPPFRAPSAAERLWEHANRPPPRIVALNPRAIVPSALEDLVARLLVKEPAQRIASAEEVLAALDRAGLSGAMLGPGAAGSQPPADPTRDPMGEAELAALAERVREGWISGVLEASTAGMAMVPQRRRVTIVGAETELVDARDSLRRVFERAGGRLQIVAPAGYGKTVQLLRLARTLLDEHRSDRRRPLPVIFNMSAWQAEDAGLGPFLVRELASKYAVPPARAREWIAQGRLLPLLDGIDEVHLAWRPRAVAAIGDALADAATRERPMVLSFRPELGTLASWSSAGSPGEHPRPVVGATVELCELEGRDTARFLAGDWQRLRAAFERFPQLEELSQTPLMLHLMRVSVADSDFLATPQTASSPTRWLYDRYVHALLSSPRAEAIDRLRTPARLGTLGRTLARAQRAMLLFEELQPAILASATLRGVYLVGSRMISAGLLCSLAVLTIAGSPLDNRGFEASPRFAALLTIAATLALGLGFAAWTRVGPRLRGSIAATLGFGVVLGAGVSAGLGLAGYVHEMVWVFGIEAGLVGAAVLGIARRSRSYPERDIETVESLRWDLRRIPGRHWLLLGAVALTLLLLFHLTISTLAGVQLAALVSLLGAGIMAARHHSIEGKAKVNQGIHRSLGNAALVGALGFFLVFVSFGLSYDLGYGALAGAFVALVAALWFGGADVLQHLLLRGLLWVDGSLPLRPIQACDAGVHLGVLRRVGNGYMFAHASLRDYFAELEFAEVDDARAVEDES